MIVSHMIVSHMIVCYSSVCLCFTVLFYIFLEGIYMSNSNSFGGKLKKVLASMCSFVVGASGVSQADKPVTRMPNKLTVDQNATSFSSLGIGWRLVSDDAKREDSWLVKIKKGECVGRYHKFGEVNGADFRIGFVYNDNVCQFCVRVGNMDSDVWFDIPKGILFYVMRYF